MTSHGGALAPPGVVPGGAVEAVGTASLGLDGVPAGRRLRSEGRRRRPIPSPLRPATGPKGEGRLGWRRGRVRLALVVRVPPRGGAVVPSSRPPWPRPSTVTVLRPFGAPRASRGEGHAGVETGRRDPVGGRGPEGPLASRLFGEMAITAVYGTVIPSSNLGRDRVSGCPAPRPPASMGPRVPGMGPSPLPFVLLSSVGPALPSSLPHFGPEREEGTKGTREKGGHGGRKEGPEGPKGTRGPRPMAQGAVPRGRISRARGATGHGRGMAERFKAPHLKCGEAVPPQVRILFPLVRGPQAGASKGGRPEPGTRVRIQKTTPLKTPPKRGPCPPECDLPR